MKKYFKKLNELEIACRNNFDDDSDDQKVDEEYIRIRVDVLNLLNRASQEVESVELESFKLEILNFLCANMGCHLDIEVLESESANVLSQREIEFIIKNSALSRWY